MYPLMDECMHAWMHPFASFLDECMNECMYVSMNECMSQHWINVCMEERANEWMDGWVA